MRSSTASTNIVVVAAAVAEADGFTSLKNQTRQDKARLTLAGPGVNDGALTFVVPKITLRWLLETYDAAAGEFVEDRRGRF